MALMNDLGKNWGDPTGTTLPPLEGPSTEVTDEKLVTALRHLWKHEHQIRQPHEKTWKRSFDRFNNIYDFSRKAAWQSKRAIPNYTMLVRKVAWELAKPVALSQGPLFEATTDLNPWRDLLDIPTEILNRQINSNGENPGGDFLQAHTKNMMMAAITGNCWMLILPEHDGELDLRPGAASDVFGELNNEEELTFDEEEALPDLSGLPDLDSPPEEEDVPTVDEMSKRFRIRYQSLNPMDVLPDSSSPDNPLYVMWQQRLTPFQFRRLAASHGWENVEAVIQGTNDKGDSEGDDHRRDKRQNQDNDTPKRKDKIVLRHIIGTCLDEMGEAVFTKKYCSWSGKHIVQRPESLGLWHGQVPIVGGGMLERSFGTYHQSLATLNLDPQEAQNELINSLLDYLQQVINPPTEIDHDQLHQSFGVKQLKAGMVPGGILHLQKMNKTGPAVSRSATPDMPPGVWTGLQFYKGELNNTSGLADIGTPRPTRNRISADEAAERQSMSAGIWQQSILTLEQRYVSTTFRQSYLLGLQKVTDNEWQNMIQARIDRLEVPPEAEDQAEQAASDGQEVNPQEPLLIKLKRMLTWDARKRWKLMATSVKFEPKVFSAVESRRRALEKLDALVTAAEKNPGLYSSVRWRKIGEQFVLALELDPDDFLWPDEGPTAEQPPPQGGGGLVPGAPGPVSPIVQPPPGPGVRG